MKGKKKIPGFLGDLLLLATAVFCVLPFIYMILMSLKSTVNAYDFSFSLSEATLEQYIKIFTKNNFFAVSDEQCDCIVWRRCPDTALQLSGWIFICKAEV